MPVLTSLYVEDDGQTYFEEPPETPAPLFAIRAFKAALFGTPHTDQDIPQPTAPYMAPKQKARDQESSPRVVPVKTPKLQHKVDEENNPKARMGSLISPAKGILVTPGTVTTRRKNVSFGGLALNNEAPTQDFKKLQRFDLASSSSTYDQTGEESLVEAKHIQTNLTKALYKARISSLNEPLNQNEAAKTSHGNSNSNKSNETFNAKPKSQDDVTDLTADTTIDLNQPFSRSGQHWKAEFERYHKKSHREMKKIIKQGQNVKSFAAKKDSEASELGEKLRRELSKVATMEAKVSKLAAQLGNTRVQDSESVNQAKLVDDLAKQTALAVRYKQKADRYRLALLKKTAAVALAENGVDTTPPRSISIHSQHDFEVVQPRLLLQAELDKVQERVKLAEDKARSLESENMILKNSLAKLRAEASSYEMKRLAREEASKEKEAGIFAVKEHCEALLSQTKPEYLILKKQSGLQNVSPDKVQNKEEEVSITQREFKGGESQAITTGPDINVPMKDLPFKNVLRSKTQQSHIDIWTLSARPEGLNDTLVINRRAPTHVSELGPKEITNVLKELDQNSVPKQSPDKNLPSYSTPPIRLFDSQPKQNYPTDSSLIKKDLPQNLNSAKRPLSLNSHPVQPAAAKRTQDCHTTISSPRPSMLSFPPTPLASTITTSSTSNQPTVKHLPATSRTSTAVDGGARRHTSLPAERVAAARARLREKAVKR